MQISEQVENILIEDYSLSKFPFRDCFSKMLGIDDLENLHLHKRVSASTYAKQVLEIRIYCEERVKELQSLIKSFFDSFVYERFGPIASFQSIPTMRFHFAMEDPELLKEAEEFHLLPTKEFLRKFYFDNPRLGMFHRDRDYGLINGSINLWIPVTNVWGSNSLWVGSTDNNGKDSKPIKMKYGQALFFDGANRWHGAIWNTTGSTRISFDVRFYSKNLNTAMISRG